MSAAAKSIASARDITAEDVLAQYNVDLDAGRIFWKPGRAHPRVKPGDEAGCVRRAPGHLDYWIIKVRGRAIKRARAIFLVAYGRQPEPTVDHIDRNSLNDALSNLREASFAENAHNRTTYRHREPRPMGARRTRNGRFDARICVNRSSIYLGRFDTIEEARSAYQQARAKHFGSFA